MQEWSPGNLGDGSMRCRLLQWDQPSGSKTRSQLRHHSTQTPSKPGISPLHHGPTSPTQTERRPLPRYTAHPISSVARGDLSGPCP